MSKELRQRRFPLILNEKEAEAVAEYRWRNRISSQSEAVRQLISKGLSAEASKEGEDA
jgi:hypothetical protein